MFDSSKARGKRKNEKVAIKEISDEEQPLNVEVRFSLYILSTTCNESDCEICNLEEII